MRNLLIVVLLVPAAAWAQSDQALELRNLGLAQLENERPVEAEATFRRLLQIAGRDPLAAANLAVALLRQQKGEEALELIDGALGLAPERGDLLAIKADVLLWTGQSERALELFERAAEAAPNEPMILYALYRHASALRGERAEQAARAALEQLGRLRPDNLLVMLKLGQQALAAGDRTTATGAYLRIRELLWQAPPIAATSLEQVLTALEEDDLAAAEVPALRLENVLKIAPMYKSSLAELFINVQGMPVLDFVREPEPTAFGDPLDVRFRATSLATVPGRGRALVVGDLDGDDRGDVARLIEDGESGGLEIRLASSGWQQPARLAAPPLSELLLVDLDNDYHLDLIAFGGSTGAGPGIVFWRGRGDGSFEEGTAGLGLDGIDATAAEAFDFDSEGDLDLVLSPPGAAVVVELYRNSLEGPLEAVGSSAMPPLRPRLVHQLLPRDLDRDGDIDLLLAHENGSTWLDNLRQGRFRNRSAVGGLREVGAVTAAVSADLNNDGQPDLVLAAEGLEALENLNGVYRPWSLDGLPSSGSFQALLAFDADSDGRLDLAASDSEGITILGQRRDGFRILPIERLGDALGLVALAADDLDGDGDLDLVVSGATGLQRLENLGGHRNHWLRVDLRGLNQGNDKNNSYGRGATLEVRVGRAYQYREVSEPVTHFGLGRHRRADSLRVVWANGVPQHRVHPEVDQRIVEEQVLKGSCPFLYTWNGDGISFVTDLLWGAPLGMPVAPGVWASADPSELVRVDGAVPRDGRYDLRITEELWEAAFFDTVRLWVVDHPVEVEVASNLRVVPGTAFPERVLATREIRPVAAAWDGRGRPVTRRVAARDEIYADGYPVGDYQGVTPEPWSLTFDLGTAPAAPVRLLLDGWIFPADASLNLAVAQRRDLDPSPTRLEVETAGGWRPLLDPMGFFAGKTKTMVIDTPPLPAGARRLRITTSQWLAFDRIAWSTTPDDAAARVRARLAPDSATLRYRGFSHQLRHSPNSPHVFDYEKTESESPWLPFPGRYTRFGDVLELLLAADDRSVILAPGDELALLFDAASLEPPAPGFRRTLFLESHGWDKDADRNTYAAEQLEPLPFRAMSGYPYGPGEAFPDTPLHREYRERWLTRVVGEEAASVENPSP